MIDTKHNAYVKNKLSTLSRLSGVLKALVSTECDVFSHSAEPANFPFFRAGKHVFGEKLHESLNSLTKLISSHIPSISRELEPDPCDMDAMEARRVLYFALLVSPSHMART